MTGRLKFLLIAALFAAPVVAAWVVYFVRPDWQPQGRLNYGTLIDPARPLPSLVLLDAGGARSTHLLRQKWSLLYLGGAACDATCRDQVHLAKQVRIALNQDRERIQRAYVAPDPKALAAARIALGPDGDEMLFLVDAGVAGDRAADFFGPPQGALYLLDPHGNWVMLYRLPVEARGLHKDLKRLLKFSVIG